MRRRQHDNPSLGIESLVVQMRVGRFGKTTHESDVCGSTKDSQNLFVFRKKAQTDIKFRSLVSRKFEDIMQNAVFGDGTTGDPQSSEKSSGSGASIFNRAHGLPDRYTRPAQKCNSCLSERDSACPTYEKFGSEGLLERTNLVAQRGLTDMEAVCSPVDTQVIRAFEQITERP